MNEFLLIFGMMVVTFGVRYPVLALVGQVELPDVVRRALRYVPVTVLTAITVPAMLLPDGRAISFTYTNAHLVAGVIAVIVSWRTKSLLLTIVTGMAAFYGWRLLLGVM